MFAEKEVQNLQSRVAELEQQLAEAQAVISAREAEAWGNDAGQRVEELNAIIQTLHDPVLVYDQNGVISMANASAVRAHGFDPTGRHRRETNQTLMVRYPDGRIMHSDDLPSARALKGETVLDEALTITNFHGNELSLLVTSSPLFVNGVQKGAVSVWHDITESKHIEEVLRASEAKYRSLVETAFEGVWVVDTEGHTTFVNHRMAEMLKYDSPDDLMDRSVFDFVPAEDLDQLKTKFRIRLNSKRSEQYDVRLRCRDESIIWASVASNNVLDEQGNAVGRMALFMDITERKQTEDRLRAARDDATWLARLPGENPNPVVRVSDTGIVLYHNPSAAKLSGWTCALNEPLPSPLLTLAQQAMTHGQIVEQDISLGEGFYSISVMPIAGERYANLYGKDITRRKQAEDALRESEARYRTLFESIDEGFCIVEVLFDEFGNSIDYRFLETNPAFVKHTGLHNAAGKRMRELAPSHEEYWFETYGRIALTGRSERFTNEARQLGDRWYDVYAFRVGRPEDRKVAILFTDITERRQTEAALRKRESILTQAGKVAHLGAWDIEFHNQDDMNANPLTWSDEVYRIFGYIPGEIQPSNELFFEHVHPDDRLFVQEGVAQAIATRQPYMIEHRIIRPNGEARVVQEHAEVFFDEAGRPLRILGAVQDITERKRAEQALQESERRFRSLADSMPQLVWTALPDGMVDYYNSRYREYQEIRQVKTTLWEWAPVLHPDDVQLTVDAWTHSVQTGDIYQIEHRVRMADGSYRWHLSRGVPMLDEKGQIFRWFGTATDIHDTKLAEEQLKVYTELLERSNRELEQFAFMASHDLQEPLRKIEVFGDLLLESSKSLNGRERNYLGRMRDAAKRMRDMVDGLLQLSRVMTQGKPFVQVSLSRVMEDVLYDLETQIRRTGGTVGVETLPSIDGDPLQLRQLIQNLISNALKYHLPDTAPEVKVHAGQLPGKVQIFVKDNGIGFEPGDAERVFQPFLRLVGRSQYEGSGMGLAICRRIVERHGGEITALSQPGQGATFTVTLPMYHEGSGKDVKDGEPGATSGRGG